MGAAHTQDRRRHVGDMLFTKSLTAKAKFHRMHRLEYVHCICRARLSASEDGTGEYT